MEVGKNPSKRVFCTVCMQLATGKAVYVYEFGMKPTMGSPF